MKDDLMVQSNEPGVMVELWVSKSEIGNMKCRLRVRSLKKDGERWTELRGCRVDNLASLSALMKRAHWELERLI